MSKEKAKRILFAAGGTGGHLFPAQAVAEQIAASQPEIELLFSGAGLSSNRCFDQTRFAHREITSATPFGKGRISALCSLVKGMRESLALFSDFKPDLLIGFGSYHAFPLLCAAWIKRIPMVLFESNAHPGKVIRLFASSSLFTAVHFLEAKKYLKGEVVEVSLPTRHSMNKKRVTQEEARKKLGLRIDCFTLLVFGGSQGAQRINQMISALLPLLGLPIQLIHLTGNSGAAQEIAHQCAQLGIPAYVREFEKEMDLLFSAADLAICRSGAATLAELIDFELPSLLIPFPFAADQHQLKNARFAEKEVQGSLLLEERTLTVELLKEAIHSLADPTALRYSQMRNAIRHFKKQCRKDDLSTLILERINHA
jgi:UDP-N-acetylglucosamine--N-acetylmuramyl-(pentapeptide) pyrophosphoryl-undecaprenol N-acetylglucosamine transferase